VPEINDQDTPDLRVLLKEGMVDVSRIRPYLDGFARIYMKDNSGVTVLKESVSIDGLQDGF
jgi:hypothetical protein